MRDHLDNADERTPVAWPRLFVRAGQVSWLVIAAMNGRDYPVALLCDVLPRSPLQQHFLLWQHASLLEEITGLISTAFIISNAANYRGPLLNSSRKLRP